MTLSSSSSESHASSSATQATDHLAHDAGPYAQPSSGLPRYAVDAVLIDAIRATIGPFVPEPWRTGPVHTTDSSADTTTARSEQPATDVTAALSGPIDVPVEAPVATPDDSDVALPWIDAFLDASREQRDDADIATLAASDEVSSIESAAIASFSGDTIEEVFAEPVAESVSGALAEALGETLMETFASPVDDTTTERLSALSADVSTPTSSDATGEDVASAEAWPMEEAGAAMRALADDLRTREPVESSTPRVTSPRSITPLYVPPVASTPPLPMWGDDDLMDIMPVKPNVARAPGDLQWAARARRETELAGNPEAAARALEELARRVRKGELEVPGYTAEMGDAAALAAALASLLGVRR